MATTTTLNTKIKLRYDTLANWQNVSVDGKGGKLVLLKGEVAFCEVPAAGNPGGKAVADGGAADYRPTVLFKVGDGEHMFKDLPWGSATAADVYSWAKAASKPSYNASEITLVDSNDNITPETVEAAIIDLYSTIASITGSGSGSIADQITAITGTPDSGKTLQQEIDAVEADITTLNGDVNTTGSVAKSINDAITGLNLGATYAGKAYESKVDTLIGSESGDDAKSAREMAAEEVAKVVANAPTSYDTLKEIADWIQSDSTGAAKMANDITALKTKTELGTYDNNGTPTEYATVKAYVEAVAGDLDTDLSALESAVATLNGNSSTTGSVAKAVKDAVDAIDITVAANGQGETNKVLTGFEIENGGLKANSVTTTTLAAIATTGNVNDLVQTQGDILILDGGDAEIPAQQGS